MIRVKSHYRHLGNGQLVHIAEHSDKRNRAKHEASRGKVVHADEQATSTVNHKGELQTFPHHGEMSQADIHAHLNKPLPVNEHLAHQVASHQLGIKDHSQFLKDAAEEEGYKKKPRFQDEAGAADWFHDTHVAPKLKELRDAHGKTTTRAKASQAKHKDLRDMWAAHADDPDASAHDQAQGKMVQEHGEEAHAAAQAALEQGANAQHLGPKDAPKISGLAPGVRFFGHQAEALAQMHAVEASPVDVDMGGGKGLLLPADALALMTAGKVKRPLIVVPAATLDQNAAKITDEYSGGKVNVLKISSQTIAEHHGGDIASVVKAIREAPPNTIVMATYDAIAHQDRGGGERFPHAAALASAGFDYLAADECHNIRSEDSARFQAMTHLGNAKYRRMASGTFLANDPRDVVGPLAMLYPAMGMDTKKMEQFYGRKEGKNGAEWSQEGLKRLREDLLNLGMVSLRRSAWMDKLPKRQDKLSVVQMEPNQKRIHDAVLTDVIDQLQEEAKDDPLLARALADDSLDHNWEAPPALMRRMEIMQGITDYPDELAKTMEGNLRLHAQASGDGPPDAEAEEARSTLAKFSPAARNAILGLKGSVSAKAKDVYKKAAAHLKDPKAGKFMVFCQRKASARHILAHMPPELAKEAMYFDASKLGELGSFTAEGSGPRLLIAVDASIKEGVNMQAANGLYRYDHHLTPGNQEQSYARIWRFGQQRPTDIHLGIVDGGMDVTKYARLCSKNSVNQQVVSDFESKESTPIYKLSLKNLQDNRDAGILDDYQGLVTEILDHQKGENKKYKAKYGEQPYDLSSGKELGGEAKHGEGAYHQAKGLKKAFLELLGESDLAKADWTYRQPAHVGSKHEDIGDKITNISEPKRTRVAEIVRDAIRRKDRPEKLARRLRHAVNSGGQTGDDRDWLMVAKTEVTNARSRAALYHIRETYGPDVRVVRDTRGCCLVCCKAFGKYVRKPWRVGAIPEKFRGAVHPNCRCGPWRMLNPARRVKMAKALKLVPDGLRGPAAMGLLRRRQERSGSWAIEIASGFGSWVYLDCITGRAALKAVLSRTPLVAVEVSADGRILARSGHGKPWSQSAYMLLDPALAAGARYYPLRPDIQDERTPKYAELAAKTRDEYVEVMLQVLPVVASMPEVWQTDQGRQRGLISLSDLLGYRTLTDWWVSLPQASFGTALLKRVSVANGTARQHVRRFTHDLLEEDSLAK